MFNKLNTLIRRIFGHKWASAHQTQPRKRRVRPVTDTIPLKFGSELRKQKSYWAPEEEWWYLYVNGKEMRPLTQFEAELVDMDTPVSNQTVIKL